jgi:branched-chain amino acid aminotransferase
MNEQQAYLNGHWIAASTAAVPVSDAGFVWGVTIAEQLRTFSGRIFRLQDHLDRLEHSLGIIDVDPGLNRHQWTAIAHELVERNKQFLTSGDDWGVSIFVTPGIYSTFGPSDHNRPTVCMHVYHLPFHLWVDKYKTGQTLVTTPIQQVPSQCWPSDIKCRSRMHYYLADKLAMQQEPGARAVLLDHEGYITETSTTNVLIYRNAEGLISPQKDRILPGISLAVAFEIADTLDIRRTFHNLTPDDLAAADEIILTSTPMCLLPVTRLNNRPIGSGHPGKTWQKLIGAWSAMVGLDIAEQAAQFAQR